MTNQPHDVSLPPSSPSLSHPAKLIVQFSTNRWKINNHSSSSSLQLVLLCSAQQIKKCSSSVIDWEEEEETVNPNPFNSESLCPETHHQMGLITLSPSFKESIQTTPSSFTSWQRMKEKSRTLNFSIRHNWQMWLPIHSLVLWSLQSHRSGEEAARLFSLSSSPGNRRRSAFFALFSRLFLFLLFFLLPKAPSHSSASLSLQTSSSSHETSSTYSPLDIIIIHLLELCLSV